MKLSRYQSAILALTCCSAGFLHADVVTLKDGKKLEGNILSETPTSIRMRYHLTAKIWDEKEILRTEIAEGGIVKQSPAEVELIEVRKYVPTQDLLTAEKYEQLIQDRLRPFLNRYPGTKEAAIVEKMMTEVQEEKEKVVAGGVKFEGKWLSREETKAESLNIKAYALYTAMMEKVAAKDYSGALKEFDSLADPKSGNIASIYYPKAVESILEVLNKYQAQLNQMIRDQPTFQKMRDESITKLIEPDLSRTKDAIKRERDNWSAIYEQEHKTTKWFTPYKYDLPNLQSLEKSIAEEKDLLKGLDLASITKVNDAIARLLRADAKAGKEKAELTKMGEAIVEGETAAAKVDTTSKEFYKGVFTTYRQRYAYFAQQLAQNVPGQPAPAATGAAGGSSAIAGTSTPGTDDKMAAALAAAAENNAPVSPPATPGAMPQQQPQQQPGYAQQPQQAGYQQQQGGYAQPQAAPAAAPEEEGMSTMTMIFLVIGLVVLVLVFTLLAKKKKKA
jgi:hypothetical protein